jgi:hypothetical protein
MLESPKDQPIIYFVTNHNSQWKKILDEKNEHVDE